jgi:hypothetical protein
LCSSFWNTCYYYLCSHFLEHTLLILFTDWYCLLTTSGTVFHYTTSQYVQPISGWRVYIYFLHIIMSLRIHYTIIGRWKRRFPAFTSWPYSCTLYKLALSNLHTFNHTYLWSEYHMHWVASHYEALYGHVFSNIWINHNCVIRWDVPIIWIVMIQYALGVTIS